MKLSHGIGLLTGVVGTVGLLVFVGCSSNSSGAGGDGGSGSSSGGGNGNDNCANLPATACLPPPSVPSGASKTSSTTAHNYALHKLFLGDTDRNGVTSSTAWESFGYNLDGKITTAASTDVCTLVAGSTRSAQTDGNGGIDNSFGENIMPIILSLDATASQTLNTDINAGSFTVMTYVVGFDDSAGNTTSATGLTGALLAGAKFNPDGGAGPAWNTSPVWPVLPGLLNGCTSTGGCPSGTNPITASEVQFPNAFQANGTFVNGSPSPITLSLSIGGQTLSLDIASAVISFQPDAPGSVTNGIIAGVLNTQDLLNGLQSVAGNISQSLCGGTAFASIASEIQQTSDIILTGTTVSNTAGTTCNAISIGLGFSSTEIAAPSVIAPGAPAAPNACDGGM